MHLRSNGGRIFLFKMTHLDLEAHTFFMITVFPTAPPRKNASFYQRVHLFGLRDALGLCKQVSA